jgi:hypothetical protein
MNPNIKDIIAYLRELKKSITPNLWGRMGYWHNSRQPIPVQTPLEAAPGLSIGSMGNNYAIARFSGYGHSVEANADFVSVVVNHIDDIMNAYEELEEENKHLIKLLSKTIGQN